MSYVLKGGKQLSKKNVYISPMFLKRHQNYKDTDIIAGIQSGGIPKEKALKTLYQSHLGYIYKGKSRYHLSDEAARDAYQDAIIGLMRQIEGNKFRGDSKLSTYLYKIFSNKCVDQLKKKQTYLGEELEDSLPNLPEASHHFLKTFLAREEWLHLQDFLNQLGENCKQILIMAAKGFKDEEIAESQGLKNAKTVKATRHRCRKKLSERLSLTQKS